MSQMAFEDEFLTASEAAERLGVHRSTVTRWVAAGRLIPDRRPDSPGLDGYRFAVLEVERARAQGESRDEG